MKWVKLWRAIINIVIETIETQSILQDLPYVDMCMVILSQRPFSCCSILVLTIWGFPKMVVPPKSSILIGFSIINHPFWGYPYFWKHPYNSERLFAFLGQKPLAFQFRGHHWESTRSNGWIHLFPWLPIQLRSICVSEYLAHFFSMHPSRIQGVSGDELPILSEPWFSKKPPKPVGRARMLRIHAWFLANYNDLTRPHCKW